MGKLDPEERELLESFERGEWKPIPHQANELARYRQSAKDTFRKDKRVSVRLSSRDLATIQKRALAEGIPYQTLIASVLHKYADGQLAEKSHRLQS